MFDEGGDAAELVEVLAAAPINHEGNDDYHRYLATPSPQSEQQYYNTTGGDESFSAAGAVSPQHHYHGVKGLPNSPSMSMTSSRRYVPPSADGGRAASSSLSSPRGASTAAEVVDITNARVLARRGSAGVLDSSSAADVMLSEVKELFLSVNIFAGGSHIHWTAKLFCLCVSVASLIVFGVAVFMLVDQLTTNRAQLVVDGSVCQEKSFALGRFGGSIAYTIAVFAVNAMFCVWFALRAVKLEKGGSLICFMVAGVVQVSRTAFFVFSGAIHEYYPSGEVTIALRWTLVCSIAVVAVAYLLSYAVYARFGWLTYAKGVTQTRQLEQLRRHMRFDTSVKLDTFVSVNGLITVAFLVDSDQNASVRYAGIVTTSVTVLLLLLLKTMVKRKKTWYLLLTSAVGLVSPAFFVYLLVALLSESPSGCEVSSLLPCLSSQARVVGPCGTGECLWNYNVSIGTSLGTDSSCCTFLPTASSSGEGFILEGCASMCASANAPLIASFLDSCCAGYGVCVVKRDVASDDRVIMIIVAVASVLIRATSLVLGYSRRREMEIPSVQEMFERAERNLQELRAAAAARGNHRDVAAVTSKYDPKYENVDDDGTDE